MRMRVGFLTNTLGFLPSFFFILALSPNIEGSRIAIVFVTLYVLLFPTAFFIESRSIIRRKEYLPGSVTALILLATLLIGYLMINWQYSLALAHLLGLLLGFFRYDLSNWNKFRPVMVIISLGMFLVLGNYLGLNKFTFQNIDYLIIIPVMLLNILLVLLFLFIWIVVNKSNLDQDTMVTDKSLDIQIKIIHWLIRIILFGFVIYFILSSESEFAGYFIAAVIPGYIMLYYLMRKRMLNSEIDVFKWLGRINVVNSLCYSAFFIYYFLERTQVFQAINAGY